MPIKLNKVMPVFTIQILRFSIRYFRGDIYEKTVIKRLQRN
jgi:hypothetical protein